MISFVESEKPAKTIVSRVLRWAREDAGFPPEAAANAVDVEVSRLEGWEAGGAIPISKLTKLARTYRRPFAFFLLREPPAPRDHIPDFRAHKGEMSPVLIRHQREALQRRSVFVELSEGLGLPLKDWAFQIAKNDQPEEAGVRLRSFLGIAPAQRWPSAAKARKAWQAAIEERGALVFHGSSMGDVESFRGLSIAQSTVPLIVLNGADAEHGRIFTLLHEAAHLSRRSGGVCDLSNAPEETLCNAIAACALMPRDEFMKVQAVTKHPKGQTWEREEIAEISARFRVSGEAVVRRLVVLGLAKDREYVEWHNHYAQDVKDKKPEGGGGNPIATFRRNMGPTFLRVLSGAVGEGLTTLHSASQATGVSASTFLKMTKGV
jgi:Zn-dependent peptidase ImmA (M78 family)